MLAARFPFALGYCFISTYCFLRVMKPANYFWKSVHFSR